MILVEDSNRCVSNGIYWGVPAVIAVKEVLDDSAFVRFNSSYCQTTLDNAQAAIKNAAGKEKLRFISLPALFMGTGKEEGADEGSSVAFNPGLTNLQPLVDALYLPRQFGPINAQGKDIFEEELANAVKNEIYFVDDWVAYHNYTGEVHCGSYVKRQLPADDWWQKLKP